MPSLLLCRAFQHVAALSAVTTLALLMAVRAGAAVIHVDASATSGVPDGLTWATAFRAVQAGVDAAQGGDQVWVAAATYPGKVQLKAGVALYGGFAGGETQLDQRDWTNHPTILDGNRVRSVVNVAAGATNTTRIDGFIVQNGGLGTTVQDSGGIVCVRASPVIVNNVIRANLGKQGGGIYCNGSSAVITGNHLVGNLAQENGGGLYAVQSALRVEGNTIMGNQATNGTSRAFGGGVCCDAAYSNLTTVIANNTITDNVASGGGGGIECELRARAIVSRNLIARNSAGPAGGGVEIYQATVSLEGNLIASNTVREATVGWGGGVACIQGTGSWSLLAANNGVLGNVAASLGGGIYNSSPGTVLQNNSILANTAPAGGGLLGTVGAVALNNLIAFNSSGVSLPSNAVFGHNCVFGNTGSNYSGIPDPTGVNGNISVDPLLIATNDYHLTAPSPCLDAGDDTVVDPDTLDLDGEPRMMGAHVDIGADEAVVPGAWRRALAPADRFELTATNVGGIDYGQFAVTLPDTCYRLLHVGPLTQSGKNFVRDFGLAEQTGVACADITTVLRTNFLLGRLRLGGYALTALAWGTPVKTNTFIALAPSDPTLIPIVVANPDRPRFQVLGVADVPYVVQASTNLTDWTEVDRQIGAPFAYEEPTPVDAPQRFYRAIVGP